jgi:hypothetical protein
VSSLEVEDCLNLHPDAAEAAVIGVPDERWGETIKAIVVWRRRCCNRAELIEHRRAHLAPASARHRSTGGHPGPHGHCARSRSSGSRPYREGRVRLVN